jgi:membrane protein YqaA with SNARE-associated domain
MLRRLYDWVRHWAQTPYGPIALFTLAFCESSFFPIPPDVLLIALAVTAPKKSFQYALSCSIGSVLGGVLGYLIGWHFMAGIGHKIIEFYGLTAKVDYIAALYQQYDAWAIAIAGFTPIPYKLFTISAGAFKVNFTVFIITSLLSRAARFFIVGALIYWLGPKIQAFIDKYFDILAITFMVLLVAGFVLIKYVF